MAELSDGIASHEQTLFSVGVHDIPMLEKFGFQADADTSGQQDSGEHGKSSSNVRGWIACTSDELLATKTALSDVRVQSTSTAAPFAATPTWPTINTSAELSIKATQRDLRRYKALRHGLLQQEENQKANVSLELDEDEQSNLISHSLVPGSQEDYSVPAEDEIIEDLPLVGAAYQSFMWWASAGEHTADIEEEHEQDRDLLASASEVWEEADSYAQGYDARTEPCLTRDTGGLEMAVIAYFHRMTETIFSTLIDVIERASEKAGGGETVKVEVVVTKDDMLRMGLDTWSKRDRHFVKELVKIYLDMDVDVEGASIECCGVKLY